MYELLSSTNLTNNDPIPGHNFGTHHTHSGYNVRRLISDMLLQLDNCVIAQLYFHFYSIQPQVDACGNSNCRSLVTNELVQSEEATIMSYCHLCGGGKLETNDICNSIEALIHPSHSLSVQNLHSEQNWCYFWRSLVRGRQE